MGNIKSSGIQTSGTPRSMRNVMDSGLDKITSNRKSIEADLAEKQNPGWLRKGVEYVPLVGTHMKRKREKEVKSLEQADKNIDQMMQVLMDFMKKYYA